MSAPRLRIEQIPLGHPDLREFVEFPWRLYKGDRFWSPPLRADLLGNKALGMVGMLTAQNHYHHTAEVTHFLAWRRDEVVGRVSAAINHRFDEWYKDRFGFFGFFDTINNYAVAEALLDAARDWMRNRGARIMRGPGEYSNATHERQGVLIDGFNSEPCVDQTHNYPYYGELLEKYGLRKTKDYHAYITDVRIPEDPRLPRMVDLATKRRGMVFRQIDPKRLQDEIRLVISIYNEAWSQNWGFLPITEPEADSIAATLKLILDPGLVRFAYIEDEPAAVFGAFPDPNWALRPRWKWYGDSDAVRIARLLRMRHHIPRMRLIFFGIKPPYRRMGIDALLYHHVKTYAMRRYSQCDMSLLLEDNFLIIRASEFMGGRRYKTWRIYDMLV
ncbi:MAG: N-acetyltransferase [Actinobacteria bacterium]|nr:N-acetyltransferase [Actinomycetota bacterium]